MTYLFRSLWVNRGATVPTFVATVFAVSALFITLTLLFEPSIESTGISRPKELVRLESYSSDLAPRSGVARMSYPEFEDVVRTSRSLRELAATAVMTQKVQRADQTEPIVLELVTGGYFQTFGIQPQRGRFFAPADYETGLEVAVISDRLWKSLFAASNDAIGKAIWIGNTSVTVVGIAPRRFRGIDAARSTDVWLASSASHPFAGGPSYTLRDERVFEVVGRLVAPATTRTANAEVSALAKNLQSDGSPRERRRLQLSSFSAPQRVNPAVARLRTGVWICVGLIFMMALVNVSALSLARAVASERAHATRLALGATHGALVSGLLAQAAVVSSVATGTAWLVCKLLVWFLHQNLGYVAQPVDPRAVGIAAVCAVLAATFLPTLVPFAYIGRLRPGDVLRSGQSGNHRALRLGRVLLVAQFAIAAVVATSAAVLARSFANLNRVDVGFDADRILVARVDWPLVPAARQAVLQNEIQRELRSIHGVAEAGNGMWPLLSFVTGRNPERMVRLMEGDDSPGTTARAAYDIVGPGYFRALGVQVVLGREFHSGDGPNHDAVVIVNASMARTLWGAVNPVGRSMFLTRANGQTARAVVVGVVRDFMTDAVAMGTPVPRYFECSQQLKTTWTHFYIRTSVTPLTVLDAVRAAVNRAGIGSDIASTIDPLAEYQRKALLPQRAAAVGGLALAAMTIAFAVVGMLGLQRYSVATRKTEFAVRLALGAPKEHIIATLVQDGVALAAVGAVVGIILSFAVVHTISILVFRVGVLDPMVLATVLSVLVLCVVAGSWAPVTAALRLEPAVLLRSQ